jgi:hypothetical protein
MAFGTEAGGVLSSGVNVREPGSESTRVTLAVERRERAAGVLEFGSPAILVYSSEASEMAPRPS